MFLFYRKAVLHLTSTGAVTALVGTRAVNRRKVRDALKFVRVCGVLAGSGCTLRRMRTEAA